MSTPAERNDFHSQGASPVRNDYPSRRYEETDQGGVGARHQGDTKDLL
jgi:hypothetical protein